MRTSSNKGNKLKSKKDIDTLFQTGEAYSVFPIKVIYAYTPGHNTKVIANGFTVSKKKFKRAVDRNTIKRRMRAAWQPYERLLKGQPVPFLLHQFFIFTSSHKGAQEFATIKAAMHTWYQYIIIHIITVDEQGI